MKMREMAIALTSQTTETAACALCGLVLPRQPLSGGDGERYCCQGCLHVAGILHNVGRESETGHLRLDAARRCGLLSAKPAVSDQPPPLSTQDSALGASDHTEELRFRIAGMACPSCAWLAEAVLAQQPGVIAADVDFLSDTARVLVDLRTTSRHAVEQTLATAGFGVAPLDSDRSPEERRDLVRLALAAFVACHQMMLAWVGYDTFLTGQGQAQSRMIGWVQLLFALPVVAWSALPLYRRALAALRCGRVVMESLLTLGIAAAFLLSLAMLLSGEIHVYLETATALVAISLGGRAVEQWLKRRAARSLTGLLQFGPTKARRAGDGRFAPLEEFAQGARIVVEEGEVVPLDVCVSGVGALHTAPARDRLATYRSGRIPEFDSLPTCPTRGVVVQETLLTGEPYPVVRRPGEVVLAGSTVVQGRLIGTVVRAAGHTVADAIRERVSEALRRRESGSRLADRLVQGLVPLVLLAAGASLIGHVWHGDDFKSAMLAAVAVLVIACPCAFGVAASTALSLATLRLMQTGVLVKDAAALEALHLVDTIVFDKTGTITKGDLSLIEIGWIGREDSELLAAVRALEERSRHPIGVSLVRLLGGTGILPVVEGVIETPGLGISGAVNGRRIAVGSARFFNAQASIQNSKSKIQNQVAATRVWFGHAGEEPSGFFDLADELRPEAAAFVAECKARGMNVALFSGDAPETTEAVARATGIPLALGGLWPEEKTERVRALRAEGRRVMYVGDGFNDAEALAAADVGVALGSGADLAMLSAPVVVTSQNLWTLQQLLQIACRTAKVVRGNFVWAFVYNLALLPVAAFGYLAPIYAAALMALSSASVAIHSMTVGQVGNLSSEPQPEFVAPTSVGRFFSSPLKWELQAGLRKPLTGCQPVLPASVVRVTGCQPVLPAGEVVGP
jgi:heavy metal translocating P-type ATPase